MEYILESQAPSQYADLNFDMLSLALPYLLMQCSYLNYPLPHEPQEYEGNPNSLFLTVDTYQAIFSCEIL